LSFHYYLKVISYLDVKYYYCRDVLYKKITNSKNEELIKESMKIDSFKDFVDDSDNIYDSDYNDIVYDSDFSED
jgi:hypothetical protein